MDDIVAITLFRHGLTEGNALGAYMGWNDSPLTPSAERELASNSLKETDYDFFLSSDLGRCLRTMDKLFSAVTPIAFQELREMNFGSFSGKTYDELKAVDTYQTWLNDMFYYTPPAGESYQMFADRVDIGWKKIVEIILKEQKKNIFIVTHGGVIRYLLTKLTGGEKNFWQWEFTHGRGYVVTCNKEQLRRGFGCISLQEVLLTGSGNG